MDDSKIPEHVREPFPELARLQRLNAADDPELVVNLANQHNYCARWYCGQDRVDDAMPHFKAAVDVMRDGIARFDLGHHAHEVMDMAFSNYATYLMYMREPAMALEIYTEAVAHLDAHAGEPIDQPLYRGILAHGRSNALEELGRHEEALADRVEALAQFSVTEDSEHVPDFHRLVMPRLLEQAEDSIRLIGE